MFRLVILWKMQTPRSTLSFCKAMKDFYSNLKFTSVALGHLGISYQTFSNFHSDLLQPFTGSVVSETFDSMTF